MSLFQRGLKCLDDAIVAKKLALSGGGSSSDAKADSKSAGSAAAGAAGTDAKAAAVAEGKGEAAKPAFAALPSCQWADDFDGCCAQRCCTAWELWRCRSVIRSRECALPPNGMLVTSAL
jgi:hypothetical protein